MIVVFGAAGFIGTYFVDQLVNDGFDVLAVDKCNIGEEYYNDMGIPFINCDITSEKEINKLPTKNIKSVVNLACLQPANMRHNVYKSTDFFKVNVIGTLNVLDYCKNIGVSKIIYMCSLRNTQGLWADAEGPISEEDGISIKYTGEYSMFSISETAASESVMHYSQQYGIQGIILRIPPVYGYGPHTEIYKEGKPLTTGLQIFIEKALAGKPLEVWGNPQNGRDIIYVKDVVSAMLLSIKSNTANGLYNVASGRLLTLEEQVRIIAKIFSPDDIIPEIKYLPEKDNSIESYVYDISKVKRELKWIPKYSFDQMMVDYKNEMELGRFEFLVKKRKQMFKNI
ncbi:MAG: NAD-dependent epimerase/dehydratase family protein [Bacilli bacterium]